MLAQPAWCRAVLAVVFMYVVSTLIWVVLRDTGHGWKTADWLINYQGGFVRRGLIGQSIFMLGSFISPVYVATALQTSLFASVVWLAARLPGTQDRLGWMILLSPLLMLFYLYDHSGSMRKEMLGFLFLLLFVHWSPVGRRRAVLLALLFFVAVFSHEVSLFALPFLAWLLWRRRDLWPGVAFTGWVFACVPLSFLSAMALVHTDTIAAARIVCESYQGFIRPEKVCGGAIGALVMTPGDALYGWGILSPTYMTYFIAWVVACLPFFIAWRARDLALQDLVFMLLSPLMLLPLFMMGGDWGRWLHCAFFMSSILFFALRRQRDIAVPLPFMLIYMLAWGVCHVGCGMTTGAFAWGADMLSREQGMALQGWHLLLQRIQS